MSRPKSGFLAEHGDRIRIMYVEENKSMQEIADELKTNVQRIYRSLASLRIKTRSKSEAQKNALSQKRATHPTLGKKLSDEQKQNLSKSIAEAWANLSEEEYQKRVQQSKDQYAKMSKTKKDKLQKAATKGILKAAKEGSKLERFLLDKLTESGYNVVFHKKGYIINDKLEIDLLLPAQKIAIEVDGVYHSEDIFGDLAKVINKDNEKNGLLLNEGYVVIRLSNTTGSDSAHYFRRKFEQLLEVIKKIEDVFPPQDKRLIKLEE